MDTARGRAVDAPAEVARRIGELASERGTLVVFIEQFGSSPLATATRAKLEQQLARDARLVLAHLADGVSVPQPTPPGGGYSEAIGMRIPTPSPDVTVQITDAQDGIQVSAVRHTGPSRVEALFQLRFAD